MFDFHSPNSSSTSVYAAARETEQGERGGEVSGDQRRRPAKWKPAVDDQEHDRREADPSVLQQGDLTTSLSLRGLALEAQN